MRLIGNNGRRLPWPFLGRHIVNTTLLPIVNQTIFMACIAMLPRHRSAPRPADDGNGFGEVCADRLHVRARWQKDVERIDAIGRELAVRASKERKIAHGAQTLVTVTRERRGNAWSGAAGGDRTHDPWLRRPILYPLSYSRWGKQEVSRRIQSFCNDVYGDGCEAANSYQNTIFATIIARSGSSVEFRVCASSRLRFF